MIILREFTLEDFDAFWECYTNPLITRYFYALQNGSQEKAHAILEAYTMHTGPDDFAWAICSTENQMVGCIQLFRSPISRTAHEIAYYLNPKHWGHGYMHEALTQALEQVPQIKKIIAMVEPSNESSMRVLHKVGFTYSNDANVSNYMLGNIYTLQR